MCAAVRRCRNMRVVSVRMCREAIKSCKLLSQNLPARILDNHVSRWSANLERYVYTNWCVVPRTPLLTTSRHDSSASVSGSITISSQYRYNI